MFVFLGIALVVLATMSLLNPKSKSIVDFPVAIFGLIMLFIGIFYRFIEPSILSTMGHLLASLVLMVLYGSAFYLIYFESNKIFCLKLPSSKD